MRPTAPASCSSKAQRVFDLAFWPGRPARSNAYRSGVFDTLLKRLDGVNDLPFPYQMGSAEADAYLAGIEEGLQLVQKVTGAVGGAA